MPTDPAAEYLQKAEECRMEANRTSRSDEKAAWLRMAEDWLRLSRSITQDSGLTERLNTRVDGSTVPMHPRIVIRPDPGEDQGP